MDVISIAIYLDTENIQGNLSIQDLLDDINLKVSGRSDNNVKTIFSFKKAVGDHSSISRFRKQLKELNFEIQDTPHISNKKNRADLIICLDAFEKLYINNPSIDLFVFLTNDSDYSVIMDILRRYNKEVWLVATEKDAQKTVFKSSADNILLITDYQSAKDTKTKLKEGSIDDKVIKLFLEGLKVGQNYTKHDYNQTFIKNLESKKLSISKSSFIKIKGVYKHLQDQGIINIKKNNKGDFLLVDNSNKSKECTEEINLPDIKVNNDKDKRAIKAILKVLKSYNTDQLYLKGSTNNSFRLLEKTLDMSDTRFKNFNGLYKFLGENKIISLTKNQTNMEAITPINKKIINKLLEQYG